MDKESQFESIFTSKQSKIGCLLECKTQIIVPDYQRDYVWKEDESQEFLEDVREQKDKALFIGSIILQEDPINKALIIIDGQQRITTILTLLIALRVFTKQNFDDESLVYDIQRYISFSVDKQDIKPRLKTSGKIEKSFERMCQPDWNGEYTKEMGRKVNWNRIGKSYEFFYRELERRKYDGQKIRDLLKKIKEVDYIHITVHENLDDTIATFERVNAKGRHLEEYELVKAYLFSKDEISDQIKSDWEEIEKYSEESSISFKDMLLHFYLSKRGYIKSADIYKKLKVEVENNPQQFIDELKKFFRFYSLATPQSKRIDRKGFENFLTEEDGLNLSHTLLDNRNRKEKIIRPLFALSFFNVKPVYYLIYTSLVSLSKHGSDKDAIDRWIELLAFLEKYYFVNNSVLHRTPQYSADLREINMDYCKEFRNSNDKKQFIDVIVSLEKKMKGAMPDVKKETFVDNFVNNITSRRNKFIIHYIFDRLNNTTLEGASIEPSHEANRLVDYTNNETIEHIRPQTPSNKNKYTEEEKESLDNIGNLFIIDKGYNSTLNNKPIDEKVELLKQWWNNGEIQNRQYIQEFIDDYKKIKEWDEQAIEERGRKLAQRMYDITYYKDKK